MRTELVKFDLMDYVTNRLSAQERERVEQHLQKCPRCHNQYLELLATDTILKKDDRTVPFSVYYSTILPRVRKRLDSHRRSFWDYGMRVTKIVLPLSVSIILVILLIRTTTDTFSESTQAQALRQAVMDLNADEVVQAVEKEYTGVSLLPNQEVAAAGVAEHLRGDQFLKSAISKQIENEEMTEIDIEGIISELDGEQIDQILSGLSERNIL